VVAPLFFALTSGFRLDRDAIALLAAGGTLRLMSDEPVSELHGNAAKRFVETQLQEVEVDAAAWTTRYRNPRDGSEWLLDYPHSEVHGGGSPRLRRLPDAPRT
jgi:hypothetical protein